MALVGIATIALAGCPDPDDGNNAARLVGSWDEVPGLSSEDLGSVTFRADGTFELIDDESSEGTFTADARTLTMTTDAGDVDEVPYAVEGSRFTPVALRRAELGAGFVGEWRAEGRANGDPTVIELVVGADNSFELDLGEDLFTGTWSDAGGELVTTIEVPVENGQTAELDIEWHSVDGAISLLLYERR